MTLSTHATIVCCEQDVASNKSDTFSECAFVFFSNVVKAYEADTPLVQELANLTLKTLSAADMCEEQFRPKVRGNFASSDVSRFVSPHCARRPTVLWLVYPTTKMMTATSPFDTRSAGSLWAWRVGAGRIELYVSLIHVRSLPQRGRGQACGGLRVRLFDGGDGRITVRAQRPGPQTSACSQVRHRYIGEKLSDVPRRVCAAERHRGD